jgi:hypothetical protein
MKIGMRVMKGGLLLALSMMVLAGCASAPKQQDDMPKAIRDAAYKNAPATVIAGVGSADNTSPAAKDIAATRARAEISRQLGAVVSSMVTDYQGEAGKELSSYVEVVNQSLSRANLVGSKIVESVVAGEQVWVVVYYEQAAAKVMLTDLTNSSDALDSGQKAALNALDRMDKAFKNLK